MALTVQVQPDNYSPVYNDMMFIVSTTNASALNFFVRAQVEYFDDDEADYVQEGRDLDIFPVPGTNHILFNPKGMLRNKVTHDFDILNGATTTGQRSAFGEHYRVNFQEYMGTVPQASGSVTSEIGFVFNAALERREYARYNENEFVINASELARFMIPVDEIWVKDTDTYLLTLMSNTTGGTALYTKLRVEKFDYSGASLGTSDISMLSPEDEIRNRFQSVRCGPAQVGASSDVNYYEIWAASAGNTQRTEKLRVWIDRDCSKYESQKIYWLNRFGGIDMLNFPLVSRHSVTTERKQYNRPVGEDTSDPYAWNLNSYDMERSTYSTKTRNRLTLNTDYLNDTQAIFIKDLMTSPIIWWYDDEFAEFVTMQMERSEYETKRLINDGQIQEEIILVESLENVRQRC